MVDCKSIIERVKRITGYTQKEIAVEIFGISDKNLSNKIKRGSIDFDTLIEWCGNENVDLNWLLVGKGNPYMSIKTEEDQIHQDRSPFPVHSSRIIESDYDTTTQQFSDINYAKDLNECLGELEKLKPEAFKEIAIFAKGVLEGVRMITPKSTKYAGPERRVAERRVKDTPDKSECEKDRRSGNDRRIAINE